MRKCVPLCFLLVAMLFTTMGFAQGTPQQPRTVLIEQFTGTWCQWCPYGADIIKNLLATNPYVTAIAYHMPQSSSGTEPMNTPEATSVNDSLAVSGYPTGAVDRHLWQTGSSSYALAISRGSWSQAVTVSQQVPPGAEIYMAGTYHISTRVLNLSVSYVVPDTLVGEYFLFAVLVQDSLNFTQTYYQPSGTVTNLNPYWHLNVMRKMITGPNGMPISTSGSILPGVYTKTMNYTMPSGMSGISHNLRLIVFIARHYGIKYGSRDIVQAQAKPYNAVVSTVPVELMGFNGARSGDGIRLFWRTASEEHNQGFDIERRPVDGTWSTIGFVEGRGTTKEDQYYEFVDAKPTPGQVYEYRLRQKDYDGSDHLSDVIRVDFTALPTTTRLTQNYPNPFNPTTFITMELASPAPVTLQVFDAMGRLVSTLAQGEYQAGSWSFRWDGTDANGMAMPTGLYYYRLTTPTHSETRQMMMAR